MTVGERARIDAKIAQLKEIAAKYGGEKTINSIIQQLEEIKEKQMEWIDCWKLSTIFENK